MSELCPPNDGKTNELNRLYNTLFRQNLRIDARQQIAGLTLQHAMSQVIQMVGQGGRQIAGLQPERSAAYDDERSEFRFAELNGVRLI